MKTTKTKTKTTRTKSPPPSNSSTTTTMRGGWRPGEKRREKGAHLPRMNERFL